MTGTTVQWNLTIKVTLVKSKIISHSEKEYDVNPGNTFTSRLRPLLPSTVGDLNSEVSLYIYAS